MATTDSEHTAGLRKKWDEAARIERETTYAFMDALRAGQLTPALEQALADAEAAQEAAWDELHRSMLEDHRRAIDGPPT